jgi:hypothetical protein
MKCSKLTSGNVFPLRRLPSRVGRTTVLAGKGSLRRFAPLPTARRCAKRLTATGGAPAGTRHGLLPQRNLQNLTDTLSHLVVAIDDVT